MSNALQKIALGIGIGKTAVTLYNAFTKGAEKPFKNRPQVLFAGKKDYRAKLIIPDNSDIFSSGPLGAGNLGGAFYLREAEGIVFPFTPQITFETSASYTNNNPIQSNYTIYSYKHSAVGAMTLTAKFTVQNDNDAAYYLGVLHILRMLTKGRVNAGRDAGAPPRICRLYAYGEYMLENIPVAVTSFRTELMDQVDYYRVDPINENAFTSFGSNFIPTLSTITIGLIPMYSRAEMQEYTQDKFGAGNLVGKGYL